MSLVAERYYDHVLHQEEDRLRVTAYLLGNPIRAGLLTHSGEYPFWGSAVWSRDELIEAVQDLASAQAEGGALRPIVHRSAG